MQLGWPEAGVGPTPSGAGPGRDSGLREATIGSLTKISRRTVKITFPSSGNRDYISEHRLGVA